MGHEGFFSCSFFAGSDLIRSRMMMLLLSASLPLVCNTQKRGCVFLSTIDQLLKAGAYYEEAIIDL